MREVSDSCSIETDSSKPPPWRHKILLVVMNYTEVICIVQKWVNLACFHFIWTWDIRPLWSLTFSVLSQSALVDVVRVFSLLLLYMFFFWSLKDTSSGLGLREEQPWPLGKRMWTDKEECVQYVTHTPRLHLRSCLLSLRLARAAGMTLCSASCDRHQFSQELCVKAGAISRTWGNGCRPLWLGEECVCGLHMEWYVHTDCKGCVFDVFASVMCVLRYLSLVKVKATVTQRCFKPTVT